MQIAVSYVSAVVAPTEGSDRPGTVNAIQHSESEPTNDMDDRSQGDEDSRALANVLDGYGVAKVRHVEYVCGCIPCGGVLFMCIMLGVSYASGLVQAITLAENGDYMFAGLLGIFLGASIYYQKLVLSPWQVWSLTPKPAETGVMELDLLLFFNIGTYVKDAFTLFLAPYCVLKISSLGVVRFAFCTLSLLLGCKTLSTELKRSHLGGFYCQFGEALVKCQPHGKIQLNLLNLWIFSAISSQVAFNALFMCVFHPVVLFVLYLPVTFVNFCFGPAEHTAFTKIKEVILEPGNLLAAFRSSVFGFGQWDPYANIQQGNKPARHHCVAQIVRTIMMLVLMGIDFPTTPIRPMGLGVLHRELLVPVNICIDESVESWQELVYTVWNFTLNNHTYSGGGLQDFCPMGVSAYKTLLGLMVVFGLPLYVAGMVVLLVSPSFRLGEPHDELNDALTDIFCDVAQFLPEDPNSDDHEYYEISGEVPADSL